MVSAKKGAERGSPSNVKPFNSFQLPKIEQMILLFVELLILFFSFFSYAMMF